VKVPGGVRAPAALPEPGHPQLPALQDHVQGRAEQDQAPHQDKVRVRAFPFDIIRIWRIWPGRIIRILPGHNLSMTRSIRIQRFCLLFDKMEPPRQDQAPHQDKVRDPSFGIIRI
jgi:hypothetical protein